jgi:hypothetical protein
MSRGWRYFRHPTPAVPLGAALLLFLLVGAALAFLPAAVAQQATSQGSSGAREYHIYIVEF